MKYSIRKNFFGLFKEISLRSKILLILGIVFLGIVLFFPDSDWPLSLYGALFLFFAIALFVSEIWVISLLGKEFPEIINQPEFTIVWFPGISLNPKSAVPIYALMTTLLLMFLGVTLFQYSPKIVPILSSWQTNIKVFATVFGSMILAYFYGKLRIYGFLYKVCGVDDYEYETEED